MAQHPLATLKAAMKAKGWDHKQLAAESGVHVTLIGRYLTGEVEVGAKCGVKLARALGVHLEDILGKKYVA